MNEGVSTKYLDGMRVVACFVVLIYHFGQFTVGMGITRIFSGPYAVTFFLILSGLVMALSFFKKGRTRSVDQTWVFFGRRYMRLLPAAAIGTFLGYAAFVYFNYAEVVYRTLSVKFLKGVLPFQELTFVQCLREAFIDVFLDLPVFDRPLWTLKHELIGIFLIYILCELCYDKKWRHILYLALAVALSFIQGNVCKLLVGMWIGDVWRNPHPAWFAIRLDFLKKKWVQYALLLLGCGCVGYFTVVSRPLWLEILSVVFFIHSFLFMEGPVKKGLESRAILYLSKHTYMVYCLHWPLIASIGCLCLLQCYRHTGMYLLSVGVMAGVVTLSTWALAIGINALIARIKTMRSCSAD